MSAAPATTIDEFAIAPVNTMPGVVDNVLDTDPTKVATATDTDTSDQVTIEFAVGDESGKAATDVIEPAHRFQTIAVTWPMSDDAPHLQVRVRSANGDWGQWFTLIDDGAEPDPGQQSMSGVRAGSDTIFVGEATAFQLATVGKVSKAVKTAKAKVVTIGTIGGTAPSPALEIVNAAYIPSAGQFQNLLSTGVNQPKIVTRAEWGAADPKCTWPAAPAVQAVIVHHTAGTNSYNTQAEAMKQIRNDQAYHQKTRGWCDIGYNFIVDKWGNIYEGAAGSLTSAIIGGHTAGFNTGSVGVSMLGNYDAVAPNSSMVAAIGQLAAWKLSAAGVDPNSQVSLEVHGATTKGWKNGAVVNAAAISAHRDLGATLCPGAAGYSQMDAIRAAAAKAMGGAPAPAPAPAPATAEPKPAATVADTGRTWLTINEMKALQRGLNRVFPTYSKLAVDGDLGPATKAVLKEFQRRNKLPVTGMPDAATKAALAKFKIVW